MSVVEDFRKVVQDFIAPELRAISARLDAINIRLESMEKLNEVRFQRLEDKINSSHEAVMNALNLAA